jgi:transcriptional regulator with XRE-family HTH domain
MQALCVTGETRPYSAAMQTGRPSKRPRPPFGARLHALREAAGLSQKQLADKLGITQGAYAWWERHPVALRPDQIGDLAAALGVPPAQLLADAPAKKRGSGPVGRMRQVFEAASKLPRTQQQQIAAVVAAFLSQHGGER